MTTQTPQPSHHLCDRELLGRALEALDDLLRDPLADTENSDGYARSDIERFDRTRQLIRRRLQCESLMQSSQATAAAQPVGEAGAMPGSTGFTMACFRADEVPVGTKLYVQPVQAQDPA